MPGRHSGSSDLGGGSSGGFSGGGGNFGGGNWSGDNFGGGWGGGWRPRGPWSYGSGWGGGSPWLLAGLLPFLFGPRYGRGGGGCGCGGGFGCLIVILIFLCCIMSGGLGSLRGLTDSGGYYNAPIGNPNNGSGVVPGGRVNGLAGEPPAVQTQTALDLRELHAGLDKEIAQWQRDLSPDEYHSISGPNAGLTQDNNTKEVVYGKCGQALYVFVVENTKPDTGPADGEGYVYTTASSPGACHPPSYNVYSSEDVGGGWWFATLKSVPDANQGR